MAPTQAFVEVQERFNEPRAIFNQVVNEAFAVVESTIVAPDIRTYQLPSRNASDEDMWETTISMQWPEAFKVKGRGTKKTEAEKIAYTKACEKFESHSLLDDDNMPIIPHQHLLFDGKILDNPKSDLHGIYNTLLCHYGQKVAKPAFKSEKITGVIPNTFIWRCILTLKMPRTHHIVEALSSRKSSAEKIAAAKALKWLYENNYINTEMDPILHSPDDVKYMRYIQNLPHPVKLPTAIQQKMQSVLQGYKNLKETEKEFFLKFSAIKNARFVDPNELNEMYEKPEFQDEIISRIEDIKVHDVFTEKPYCKLTSDEAMRRSAHMFEKQSLLSESTDHKLQRLLEIRKTLPIYNCRQDILKLIEENRVVVIAGETGCGKTTQVPQYVLESFVDQMKGAYCNIVVTQPRRISAISVSEHVAAERGEKVGSTVGYQIRLNKTLPKGNGAILFCTTGMFLRKLAFNKELEGVSHVVIDEIHERTNHIDFLLIMMRKLLASNKHLKLILMSASIRTSLFSEYFDNCPVYHVPGKVYPVKEYFLEDIPADVTRLDEEKKVQFDSQLVARVLLHVDQTQPKGAILCFLPGWNEIKSVEKYLSAYESKYMIRLLHSHLLPKDQALIFDYPPPEVRKIILSTNVAETSITIDDVVYVVDSCFHKDTSFDPASATSSLGMQLITKANMLQRRGRAGRVQPGVCYHLITRKTLSTLDDYPLPEMHKTSLEEVVLDCKVHNPDIRAEEFLSEAIQPPDIDAIRQGVNELQTLGLLDADENLTQFGNAVKNFATHPRLSKALVYACFLGCLDPVLTISALLTFSREPFVGTLDHRNKIRELKLAHDDNRLSDHLSLYNLFNIWNRAGKEERQKIAEDHLLDTNNLMLARQLKGLFFGNLREAGFVPKNENWQVCFYGYNSVQTELVLAALSAAFYPNVIKLIHGELKHGRLDMDAVNYCMLRNNHRADIQKDSVLTDNYHLKSPWLIYYSGTQSDVRRLTIVSSLSCVQGLTFLIFAGEDLNFALRPNEIEYEAILTIDNYSNLSFLCSAAEAQLLLEWRQMIKELFEIYLPVSSYRVQVPNENVMRFFNHEVLSTLIELLNIPQAPFRHEYLYYRDAQGNITASYIPTLFQ